MISVIIPIYNTGKLLNRMLQSIQKQSYKDLEIILINDGSTDESGQECQKAAVNDERIRYFYQENAGVSSARNYGMKLAQGEYIAFLDSDDLWMPQKLEKQIRFMEWNDYAFSYTNYEEIDIEGNKNFQDLK